MKRQIILLGFFVSSLACAQGLVQGEQPVDPGERPVRGALHVVPAGGDGSHQTDYCRLGPNNALVVRLMNIGKTPTPSQRVEVTFHMVPPTVRATTAPRVNGGQRIDVSVTMPEACKKPDCGFSIKLAGQEPIAGFCVG